MSAMDQQIQDLEEIRQIEESSGSEEDNSDDDEEMEEDSDADDIARINNYKDDDDEEMESHGDDESGEGESDDESNESEDVEMSESNSSGGDKKKLTGKKALRAQITQEKEIRAKENQIRSSEGANPQSVNDFERLLVAD
jgi:hypothetical protein